MEKPHKSDFWDNINHESFWQRNEAFGSIMRAIGSVIGAFGSVSGAFGSVKIAFVSVKHQNTDSKRHLMFFEFFSMYLFLCFPFSLKT